MKGPTKLCTQPLGTTILLSGRRSAGKGLSGRAVRAAYPYWPLWLAYFALSLNAWAASVAFHARDVRRTEVRDVASCSFGTSWNGPETPPVVGRRLPPLAVLCFCEALGPVCDYGPRMIGYIRPLLCQILALTGKPHA